MWNYGLPVEILKLMCGNKDISPGDLKALISGLLLSLAFCYVLDTRKVWFSLLDLHSDQLSEVAEFYLLLFFKYIMEIKTPLYLVEKRNERKETYEVGFSFNKP